MSAHAGAEFGGYDVRDQGLGVMQDRFEHAQPLATGEVTQWTGIEDVGRWFATHEVTAQISDSETGGRSGSASTSNVPSNRPSARSALTISLRYSFSTACS